ncbi:hypothetical protein ACF0H5_014636 [Mactra antiquata]
MDDKRASGRSKKPAKPPEEGSWDCSVCTYKNSAEAYKCEMCDVRKGTSTRKPKINPQLVAQQVAQQYAAPLTPPPGSPVPEEESHNRLFADPVEEDLFGPPPAPPLPVPKKEKSLGIQNKGEKSNLMIKQNATLQKQNKHIKKKNRPPRLKNVDRSSAQQMSVTVDNVTVVITDYQPKKRKISSELNKVQSDMSDSSSNASNDIHDDRIVSDHHT